MLQAEITACLDDYFPPSSHLFTHRLLSTFAEAVLVDIAAKIQ